jgi:hypothetical protein
MRAQTVLTVDDVANDDQRLELILKPNNGLGGVFVQTGQYSSGGVTLVLDQDRNIQLESQASCFSAEYTAAQVISFTCYAGQNGNNCMLSANGYKSWWMEAKPPNGLHMA